MPIKATNEFVFVIRDKAETEKGGLILPSGGKEKPHSGTIFSCGSMVKDGNIKSGKGRKCLFHKTVGFPIEYEGEEYLILLGSEIIAVI